MKFTSMPSGSRLDKVKTENGKVLGVLGLLRVFGVFGVIGVF